MLALECASVKIKICMNVRTRKHMYSISACLYA